MSESRSAKAADIQRLEVDLFQHQQQLAWHRAAGNRAKAVMEKLRVVEIEMTIAQLRRELGQ